MSDFDNTKINRRQLLAGVSSVGIAAQIPYAVAATKPRWVSTSRGAVWQDLTVGLSLRDGGGSDVHVAQDQIYQTIDGFGACFNELGWDALRLLSRDDREEVLSNFFSSRDVAKDGLALNNCRMPVAANDFARDWYSFNETAEDFSMRNFSIARDKSSLIPYINLAKVFQPNLKLWASPWSPPTWMKTNGHYAQNIFSRGDRDNGLTADKVVREGEDGFIQKRKYFKAYALYFKRFIEAYRHENINIEMVMPQNEFNSSQVFPSCLWTPEALARFVPYLQKQMDLLDVDIFLGTLERPDSSLFDRIYAKSKARDAIKGVGFQWAGRDAAALIHHDYPHLKLYQTEQECGDGKNDWRFARYSWDLMRDYMESGVSVYNYWNMALVKDQPSSWGWKQNSLISVDPKTRTFEYTPDYYVFKHVAHFVKPGAKRVNAKSWTGYDNALAFVNPDGQQIMVFQNDHPHALPVNIGMGGKVVTAELPANSLNTIAL